MKKKIITLASALFVTFTGLRADTSYLLIQGPFGAGGTLETFQWQVNYQIGALAWTGQDLLTAVFGTPTLNGTYAFDSTLNYYKAGNSTQGVGYIDFGSQTTSPPSTPVSPFVVSFTLGSNTVAQDPSYSPGFNYYVAGGGSAQTYPNAGAWTYSGDGLTTRTLANGSYDAWVYGNTYPAATVAGAGNAPTTADFAGATVINVVPEPTGAALLLLGAGGLCAFSKRRRA
jgi:hypothetical protein